MGRTYTHGKGISSSCVPYNREPPSWNTHTPEDLVELIVGYARKGHTPSQIGIILRDSHSVFLSRHITGRKILRILKSKGLAPEVPEDLYNLIKRAVSIKKHLEKNKKDTNAKHSLILTESRIHRVARYYKRSRKLPPRWKYDSSKASSLVS